MITVSFTKDSDTIALTVSGHAGAAEAGRDIVCASASILTYTVAQASMLLDKQGKLQERPSIKLEVGKAVVRVKPRKKAYEEALNIFSTAEIGYVLLTQNYPQNVELKHMIGKAKALT